MSHIYIYWNNITARNLKFSINVLVNVALNIRENQMLNYRSLGLRKTFVKSSPKLRDKVEVVKRERV